MLIIGCDYHPSMQQIAWVDTETGECGGRRLMHQAEAEQFYRELKGKQVRIGMEATGHSRWFEHLLAELHFELWVGDPARIRVKQVRKQKNDRRDADHILKLMLKDDFPRIWAPTPENRDLRQLILHRHRMVGMRTRVMNQLQAVAMNEGIRRKKGLWSEKGRQQLESLSPNALDDSTPAGIIGVTGPVRSQHRRAEPGDRARSRGDGRSEITNDTSRSWTYYGSGFRVGHGYSGTVWLRQAGG